MLSATVPMLAVKNTFVRITLRNGNTILLRWEYRLHSLHKLTKELAPCLRARLPSGDEGETIWALSPVGN